MTIRYNVHVPGEAVRELFASLDWESARYPDKLAQAIANSHRVVSLWDNDALMGIVTAISDGSMCVYFPYVAIAPAIQGQGWGRRLIERALLFYNGFHHIALISYAEKGGFYESCGFSRDDGKKAYFYNVEQG